MSFGIATQYRHILKPSPARRNKSLSGHRQYHLASKILQQAGACHDYAALRKRNSKLSFFC
jgi:hypothetical protein